MEGEGGREREGEGGRGREGEGIITFMQGVLVVSCPDPTQLTRGEGVWCHKSECLGQLQKREAANEITERCLLE